MKAYVYARKSRDRKDAQVYSIEDQVKVAKSFAKNQGLEIVEIYEEEQSASVDTEFIERPVFSRMLRDMMKNKVKNIITWRYDRLTRNYIDQQTLEMLSNQGVIETVYTPERIYRNNTGDKLQVGMEVVFAKHYVDVLRVNVNRGMQGRFEEGRWLAMAPMGFKWDNSKLILDEKAAYWVKRIFSVYSTGQYSLSQLARMMEAEGFHSRRAKNVSPETLRKILTNEFYIGIMHFGEWTGPHRYEKLIEQPLFERVHQLLSGNTKGRASRRNVHWFPFKKLLSCGECGSRLTVETQKGTDYFSCKKRPKNRACTQRGYIARDRMEELILGHVHGVLKKTNLPESWIALRIRSLKNNMLAQAQIVEDLRSEILKDLNKREGEKSRFIKNFNTRDHDDEEWTEYATLLEGIKDEIKSLKKRLEEIDETDDYFGDGMELVELFRNLSRITKTQNPRLKDFFARLISSNYSILSGQLSNIALYEPYLKAGQLTESGVQRTLSNSGGAQLSLVELRSPAQHQAEHGNFTGQDPEMQAVIDLIDSFKRYRENVSSILKDFYKALDEENLAASKS